MKTNKLKYLTITAVFFLIGNMNALANGITPPGPDATPDPEPGETEASIDQAMIWLLIVGIVAAFYFLQTKKAVKPQK